MTGLGIGTGYLATVDVDGTQSGPGENDSVNLTAWINIATDNVITIFVPFVEMGQGTHTGLAQLVAEELGLDLSAGNIRVTHPQEEFAAHTNLTMFLNQRPEEMSGPLSWYGKRFLASMKLSATGASSAVVGNWHAMRHAGAIARQMLQAAAARHLDGKPDDLILDHALFKRADGANSVSFGTIAKAAAKIDPPTDIALKPAAEFSVIGKPIPRMDAAAKITGRGQYGVDVRLPGMAFATVRQAPVFGATIKKVEDKVARSMRGVIDVIIDGDSMIVVADNTWRAFQAAEALEIEYTLPEKPVAGEDFAAAFKARHEAGAFTQSEQPGDAANALSAAAKKIEAEYHTPYLAHATMEPMNSTVWWKPDDTVEVWAPTQSAAMARQVIESVGGASSIKVHVTFAGGGFGRRAEKNFVIHAAKAAKAHKGRPIQLTWSRTEDMQHDVYRPAAIAKLKAGLDENGQLTAFDAVIGTHSVMASFLLRNMDLSSNLTADNTTLEGIAHMPYQVRNRRIAAVEVETSVPIGFWRSVGHSNNAFFVESMIDECAVAAGKDAFDFRLAHLGPQQRRHKKVLETLRDMADWTGRGGNGRGRGVALHESFRSIVGAVIDIDVDSQKQVTLNKVVAVIDCGTIINPRLVEAQVQSGIIFGLTAACFGRIDIADGMVAQENFDSYEMLTLARAPSVEVHLMTNAELPGGVGEPGTPPAAPALANAIFSATGERIRRLPISEAGYAL